MWHSARRLPDSTVFISPCQPSVPFFISRSQEPSSPELRLCRDGGGSGQPKTGHQRPALWVAEDHKGLGGERPGLTRALLPGSSPQLSWLLPQTTASPTLAGRAAAGAALQSRGPPASASGPASQPPWPLLRRDLQRPRCFGTQNQFPTKYHVRGSVRRGLIWRSQRPIGSFHGAHNFGRLFLLDHFHCALPPSCFLEITELGWLGEEACALRHEGTSKSGEISEFPVCLRKF